MESYRIVLRSGAEEEIGPADLIDDDGSFVFRSPNGVRSFAKDDVLMIEEESEREGEAA